jgi:hypothetical protein
MAESMGDRDAAFLPRDIAAQWRDLARQVEKYDWGVWPTAIEQGAPHATAGSWNSLAAFGASFADVGSIDVEATGTLLAKIEIKATRGQMVSMSNRQGEEAGNDPSRFWLRVVPLESDEDMDGSTTTRRSGLIIPCSSAPNTEQ